MNDDHTSFGMIEQGTHIAFFPQAPNVKTKIWSVQSKYGDGLLGSIRWFAHWRKYSFFPAPECVFEEVCLREIAEFVERKTKEHKAK